MSLTEAHGREGSPFGSEDVNVPACSSMIVIHCWLRLRGRHFHANALPTRRHSRIQQNGNSVVLLPEEQVSQAGIPSAPAAAGASVVEKLEALGVRGARQAAPTPPARSSTCA